MTDNAGWTKEGTANATTKVANTAPTVTASFASKDTNYITIYATGQDKEGGTLTYTLYVKTASGNWQSKATTTGSPSSRVTLTASGLTQYTNYYYKVDVRDNGNLTGTTGQLGAVRTYCPGQITHNCSLGSGLCHDLARSLGHCINENAETCGYCGTRIAPRYTHYVVRCATCGWNEHVCASHINRRRVTGISPVQNTRMLNMWRTGADSELVLVDMANTRENMTNELR